MRGMAMAMAMGARTEKARPIGRSIILPRGKEKENRKKRGRRKKKAMRGEERVGGREARGTRHEKGTRTRGAGGRGWGPYRFRRSPAVC